MVRKNNFKRGDVVKFKSWDTMVEQYGIGDRGEITCPGTFTPEMRLLFCNDNTYNIRDIIGSQVYFTQEVDYVITTAMIELVTDIRKYDVIKRPDNVPYELTDLYGAISETYRNVFANISVLTERAFTIMHLYVDDSVASVNWFIERINRNPSVNYIMFIDKRLSFVTWDGNKGRYNNAWFFIGDPDVDSLEYMISESLDTDTAQLFFDLRVKEIENMVNKKLEIMAAKSRAIKLDNARNELYKTLIQGKGESLKKDLTEVNNALQEALTTYRQLLEKKNQLQKDILYATTMQNDSNIEEFIEFLKNDNDLLKIDVDADSVTFDIRQELLYFDPDEYKIFWQGKYRTPLCDAIFTGKAKIVFTQRFTFFLNDFRFSGKKVNEYMGNPHIEGYNCWDENGTLIIKALAKQDYITAYMQAKSAIAGVKVTDTYVMNWFDECLESSGKANIKCIILPGKEECVTVKEANEYFEREKESAGNIYR